MLINKVIIRYARALYQISVEQQNLDQVRAELSYAHEVFSASPELVRFLRSPSVSIHEKLKMIRDIFKGKIGELIFNFWQLLLESNRKSLISEIYPVFEDIHRKNAGIYQATVTYASATASAESEKMKSFIRNSAGLPLSATIEMDVKINPRLIGGFTLSVNNKLFDHSISGQIEQLNKEIIKH